MLEAACVPLAARRPPLGAGTACRGGDTALPAFPYYFRSPKFLPQPMLPLPGPARLPGHRSQGGREASAASGTPWLLAKPSSRLPVYAPTTHTSPVCALWHVGDPRAGGFVYPQYKAEGWELSTGHQSFPPAVPITRPAADPETLVPSRWRGDADTQLAWKISRVGTQNGQHCLSPGRATASPPPHGD